MPVQSATRRASWHHVALFHGCSTWDTGRRIGSLLIHPDVVDFELVDERLIGKNGPRSIVFCPVALPIVVDHRIQNDLHRAIFDPGGVSELTAFDAIDVPGNMVRLPVDTKCCPILRIIRHWASTIVLQFVVDTMALVAIIVMISLIYVLWIATQNLRDIDLAPIVEVWIRGQHPERGEEARHGGILYTRFDVSVGERKQILTAIVSPRPGGGQ